MIPNKISLENNSFQQQDRRNLPQQRLFDWQKLQQNNDCSIPSRHHHCSVIYRNYLIILGGQQNDGKLPEELLTFDLHKLIWSEVPLLGGPLSARYGFTACIDDQDRVIIYGGVGQDNRTFVSKIELLELCDAKDLIFERKELHIAAINIARAYHTANFFEADKKIYIFGGQTSPQNEDNQLYILNLENNSIIQKQINEKLPDPRCQHSSFLAHGKLYIYGGYQTIKGSWGYYETCLGDLWMLDLALFKWNKIDHLSNKYPGPRKNASMFVTENKVFFFGGSNEKMLFNDLICYDLNNGSSEIIMTTGEQPTSRSFNSSCFYENNMIIFGGLDHDSTIYSLHLAESQVQNKKVSQEDQNQLNQLREDMKTLFAQKIFTDVTFKIEDQLIPAHKGLLAVRCPYFLELFENRDPKDSSLIQIHNIKPAVFMKLLEYLYSSEIHFENENLSKDLLRAATKFQLTKLKTACESYLRKNINLENIIDLSIIAEEFQALDLRNDVISFLAQNQDEIKNSNDFLRAPQSIISQALKKNESFPPADI